MSEPDSGGLVNCRGFGELGDEAEYEARITTDSYGDFSMGRWLWVFQDLRHVEPVSINGRQGVWTLPTAVVAGVTGVVFQLTATPPALIW